MTNARAWSRTKRIGRITCGFMAAGVVMNMSTQARALDVDPAPTVPVQKAPPPAKEPNGATVRPVAIRMEATLSTLSFYSFGLTAGYAFHPMFVLEGTAAWEEGLSHGIMGRFRIPLTPASSISLGGGATLLWVPWKDRFNPPGTYVWLPAELGYEYRGKGETTVLVGVGIRCVAFAERDHYEFGIYPFGLGNSTRVAPAARFGVGWAF